MPSDPSARLATSSTSFSSFKKALRQLDPAPTALSSICDQSPNVAAKSADGSAAAYFTLPSTSRISIAATMLLLLLSSMAWPIHAAAVSSRDSEINSVRHELAAYDNEIISEPEITCGPGVVHFGVKTKKGNASAVYVRGQSQNGDCTFHNTRNVTIELAKCNVRRKREINPNPGIAYQMTLVVQLHPLFVTKVDRAYNVNCFYREKPQDVSVDFGVSDPVTHQLYSEPQMPACTYSVHRDSPNGPRVKYTHVGEQLWHVWECPSKMYSMLLYNCQAIDGKGAEYAIVDANGCSKDEYLMPQISYTQDRTKAMAASAAFNFPDRNTMSFTCKIKLCMNSDADCSNLTPPNCNGKRTKSTTNNGNFNEDTSGEHSQNRTSEPTPSPAPPSSPSTPSPALWETSSSTAANNNGASKTEVSGEVIADIETDASTVSGTTGAATKSSNDNTRQNNDNSQRGTASPTVNEEEGNGRIRNTTTMGTTSSSSSSQTTTTQGTATTATEAEQLLSSQERMASASAEHNPPPVPSVASASSSSSGSFSAFLPRSGGTSEPAPTLITSTASSTAAADLPVDFPRPDLLLQKDQALLVPPTKGGRETIAVKGQAASRMEKLDESVDRADQTWTLAPEQLSAEKGLTSGAVKVPEGESEESAENGGAYRGSTKPVQVFDKRGENGVKSAARAQRDTTRGPAAEKAPMIRRKAGGGANTPGGSGGHGMVDFDISSPELMIMDDYEPAAAAQRAANGQQHRSSSIQEAPFIDWAGVDGGRRSSSGGICLSPIALICAGILLLLLLLVVTVVLIRATRKSAGTVMEHSFYSR